MSLVEQLCLIFVLLGGIWLEANQHSSILYYMYFYEGMCLVIQSQIIVQETEK